MKVKEKFRYCANLFARHLTIIILLILAVPTISCKSENNTAEKSVKAPESSPKKSEQRRKKVMNLVRRPAVAGAFYPADAGEINKMISEYSSAAKVEDEDSRLLGLVVPHAGFVYSGPVAAYAYNAIKDPDEIETIIIMGPSHRVALRGVSVFPGGVYQTPLGDLTIDDEIASELLEADPNITYVAQAHEVEHSLEVQLPFIQTVFKDVKIVTAILGQPDPQSNKKFIDKIVEISKRKKVLILASSDFSHYYDYDTANKMDGSGIESILKMSDEELTQKYYNKESELCGIYPVLTLIRIMNRLGGTKAKLLNRANSGDVPIGEKDKVVGYASIAFYESGNAPKEAAKEEAKTDDSTESGLNNDEKKELLKIARDTIYEYVNNKKRLKLTDIDNPKLKMKNGAFVTIKERGELRGCIGNFTSDGPLHDTIVEMAISAAVRDPRFPPVAVSELDKLQLEISVLSPLRKITDVNEIEVGKHGIYIIRGYDRGVLLPQVATEYGWDRETFLAQTCRKAGLPMDAWQKGAEILIFDAQVFSEDDVK